MQKYIKMKKSQSSGSRSTLSYYRASVIATVLFLSLNTFAQSELEHIDMVPKFNDNGLSKIEIVLRMSLDVTLNEESYLQLNPRENKRALEILQASNMANRQREASEHLYDAFCREIESPNTSVVVAGRIFDQAAAAELAAIEEIYDEVMAELPNEKFSNLENLLNNTYGSNLPNSSKEAEALSNPSAAEAKFRRMCERIRNPMPEDGNGIHSIQISNIE